ncbi:putative monooxygenase [Xylariaceae sp. FL1272]|nr:putative monooxygenase [Xylariaceae sp. FL1272]
MTDVLISGAGIGGLALAQALRKKGISYEIFERDASVRERRPGWVLGMHHMLDDLKDSIPDDMPPLSSISNLGPLTKDYAPEFVYYNPAMNFKGKIGVRDDGTGWIVRTSRGALIEWLGLHIPIQYDKQVVKVEEIGERVRVYFQDGKWAEGDILVGAEGSQSATRKHIMSPDPIRRTTMAMVGGEKTLSGNDMTEQLELGHSLYVVDMHSVVGETMILLVSLAEINPDGKSGRWFYALIWPDESAAKGNHWYETAPDQERYDFVREKTKNLAAKCRYANDRTVVDDSTLNEPLRLYTLIMDSMPTGRITLLGDAAHAMPPFRGEGAYHAITDALNLARAIDKVDKDDVESITAVFGPYQEEMLTRGAVAAKASEANFAKKREVGGKDPLYAWGRPIGPLPDEK